MTGRKYVLKIMQLIAIIMRLLISLYGIALLMEWHNYVWSHSLVQQLRTQNSRTHHLLCNIQVNCTLYYSKNCTPTVNLDLVTVTGNRHGKKLLSPKHTAALDSHHSHTLQEQKGYCKRHFSCSCEWNHEARFIPRLPLRAWGRLPGDINVLGMIRESISNFTAIKLGHASISMHIPHN